MFASKTPRDLNHDPAPFVFPETGMRSAAEFGPYDPRPEFDHVQHNEPNPILEALRQGEREDGSPLTEVAADYLAALDIYAHHGDKPGRVKSGEWSDADPFDVVTCWPLQMLDTDQMDHARRVLTRLANLTKEN